MRASPCSALCTRSRALTQRIAWGGCFAIYRSPKSGLGRRHTTEADDRGLTLQGSDDGIWWGSTEAGTAYEPVVADDEGENFGDATEGLPELPDELWAWIAMHETERDPSACYGGKRARQLAVLNRGFAWQAHEHEDT